LIRVAGTRNAFFARLWSYWLRDSQTSMTGYLEYLGFGARFVYGTAAYNTYSAYPVLGVGLGNYGFYFEEMLPDRPLGSMPEVLRILTPDAGRNRLITAKVFYLRLLAETGLVGTAAFFAFLVAVLGCALYLWLSPHPEHKFWGRAGLLGLAAFLLAALSFDSFAIPNMWIVFGLITASAWVYSRQPPPAPEIIPAEPVDIGTLVPAQGD
jgi:O-antigen ligase